VKILIASIVTAGYVVLQLNSMSGDIKVVRTDAVKVTNTKAALAGTKCMDCHNSDSGNMLPIRKTMNEKSFTEWVRGTGRPFVGFTQCTAFAEEAISTGDIKKIYSILYK
jgi:hypothetical protein